MNQFWKFTLAFKGGIKSSIPSVNNPELFAYIESQFEKKMNYIETDRLILRSWKQGIYLLFANMNKDSRVMRYFPQH